MCGNEVAMRSFGSSSSDWIGESSGTAAQSREPP